MYSGCRNLYDEKMTKYIRMGFSENDLKDIREIAEAKGDTVSGVIRDYCLMVVQKAKEKGMI